MCTPLAPLVFTAPASPASSSARRTSCAARDHQREAVALGRVEVEHQVRRRAGSPAGISVGWYSTARWLANHSSVRRSLHSA